MYDEDDYEGPGVPHVEIGAELRITTPTLDLNAKVGGGTVADLIVRAALDHLVQGDEWNGIRGRVRQITDEEIRAHATDLIATALNGDLRRTNTYGEPYGEPVTLRTLIADETKNALTRPADAYSRSGETVIGKLIREQVDQALKTELVEAIAEEKAKVVAAVRKSAADLIAKAITAGVGGAR